MTQSELQMWSARARATIRALWIARHTCEGARERMRYWCRVVRLAEGHRYRRRPRDLTPEDLPAAIQLLLNTKV